MIRVSGLYKEFILGQNRLSVLENLDMEISEGELISIVGVSGVGKSTLLHILGTLEKPTDGKIYFNDVDVFELNDRDLSIFRNINIGFVFQFHHLLQEFTALENVMIPMMIKGMGFNAVREQAIEILGKVGLEGRLDHKPGELSGGEQQRVAIARAIVMKPKLVLADEPTGNLDTQTGLKVFELMSRIALESRTAFVVATHNEGLARQSDRAFRLKDGKLNPEVL